MVPDFEPGKNAKYPRNTSLCAPSTSQLYPLDSTKIELFFSHDLLNVNFYELLLSLTAICLSRIVASFRRGRDLRLCLDRIGCHPGSCSWGRGIRVERSRLSLNRRTDSGPVETGD